MAFRRDSDPGKQATSLLASALVLLAGAVVTAVIVLASVERGAWKPWLAWGLLVVGSIWFVSSLRVRSEGSVSFLSLWLRSRAHQDGLLNYEPRRRSAPSSTTGNNAPPTIESVRAAKELSQDVLWVPHAANGRDRPKPSKSSS